MWVLWRVSGCWSGARVCSLVPLEVEALAKGSVKSLAAVAGAWFGSSWMFCRRGVFSVKGAMVVAVADLATDGRELTPAVFEPRVPPLALTFLKHSDPQTSLKP